MLESAVLTAFVATADAERSKAFYQSVLGLKLVNDDQFALVFDANGSPLRIQKVETFTPQPFTALGWQVDNLREIAAALSKLGVRFDRYHFLEQDQLGVWQAPSGAKVAWFKDPDGNLLSLTEMGSA